MAGEVYGRVLVVTAQARAALRGSYRLMSVFRLQGNQRPGVKALQRCSWCGDKRSPTAYGVSGQPGLTSVSLKNCRRSLRMIRQSSACSTWGMSARYLWACAGTWCNRSYRYRGAPGVEQGSRSRCTEPTTNRCCPSCTRGVAYVGPVKSLLGGQVRQLLQPCASGVARAPPADIVQDLQRPVEQVHVRLAAIAGPHEAQQRAYAATQRDQLAAGATVARGGLQALDGRHHLQGGRGPCVASASNNFLLGFGFASLLPSRGAVQTTAGRASP